MPSSPRRSPRVARPAAPVTGFGRPTAVPFAAAFGILVAAEDGYLAWLLSGTDAAFVVVAVGLAALAVAGAALTFTGRGRGWLVLALASVLPLLAFLLLVLLVGALGLGSYVALALLLLVGPIGCLALALQRPVRAWSGARRGDRPAGGRRPGAASR